MAWFYFVFHLAIATVFFQEYDNKVLFKQKYENIEVSYVEILYMINLCICTGHHCILISGLGMYSTAKSSISDPTLDLIAELDIHPIEICVGVILLLYSIAAEILAKSIYRIKDETLVSRFDCNIMSPSLLQFYIIASFRVNNTYQFQENIQVSRE